MPTVSESLLGPQLESDLVSVVIPCFGQAHYLQEAIESVLAQTHPHVETIVVDDGSHDNAAAVSARYTDVHYIRQPNRGLAAARNAGLRDARGEYVVFLDADDRLLPHAIAVGLQHVAARDDAGFVWGHYRLIAADGTPLFESNIPCEGTLTTAALLRRNHIAMLATVLFRRSVLDRMSGFDPRFPGAEDYDLYLRIARGHPAYCHHALVAEYRQHGGTLSSQPAAMLKSTAAVLRTHRRFARDDVGLWTAYQEGRRFWRSYYGAEIESRASALVHERRWADAARDLLVLARHDPAAAARAVVLIVRSGWGG